MTSRCRKWRVILGSERHRIQNCEISERVIYPLISMHMRPDKQASGAILCNSN
ncbi:hypothetical protein RSAG8_12131, partial [Rhizoctonia solani AG-8 WAC10335]